MSRSKLTPALVAESLKAAEFDNSNHPSDLPAVGLQVRTAPIVPLMRMQNSHANHPVWNQGISMTLRCPEHSKTNQRFKRQLFHAPEGLSAEVAI